ncbi:MAG: hypothetical protein GKR96_05145 [Gammaproteobacteria bacterium]|nr:hypothetical protein [Gammaproteobacteria bacterium]
MSTGIEAWKNLSEIGPIYPFVGTEVFLVVIGVVIWLVWHAAQISSEKVHHEEIQEEFKKRN